MVICVSVLSSEYSVARNIIAYLTKEDPRAVMVIIHVLPSTQTIVKKRRKGNWKERGKIVDRGG